MIDTRVADIHILTSESGILPSAGNIFSSGVDSQLTNGSDIAYS